MDIKEFKNLHYNNVYWDENSAEDLAIEFAKIHVKEALKQFKIVFDEIDDPYPFERKDKLKDIYPLENIK